MVTLAFQCNKTIKQLCVRATHQNHNTKCTDRPDDLIIVVDELHAAINDACSIVRIDLLVVLMTILAIFIPE